MRTLTLAIALSALGACEDRGGDRIGEQDFPVPEQETAPETELPRPAETAAPGEPQGLAPGAPGFDTDAPERLDDSIE